MQVESGVRSLMLWNLVSFVVRNCSMLDGGDEVDEGVSYLTQVQAALRRAVGILMVSSVQMQSPCSLSQVSVYDRSRRECSSFGMRVSLFKR